MKKFSVHLDVTLSGYVEVEANSVSEAEELVKNKVYNTSDIKYFYWLGNDIVEGDTEELEVCSKCGAEIRAFRTDNEDNYLCEDCFLEYLKNLKGVE